MNKLSIKLENCYGIEKLIHDFDFSEDNVFSIYARNGLMKTSLAKTFRLIQDGNEDEAADAIFEINGKVDVSVDGKPIEKEQVFVIKSYESSYESDISPLLVKGEIQEQLKEVFEARTKLLKALEKSSGLKTKRISGGKTILELEPQIIEDFGLKEKSILLCLDELKAPNPDIFWDDIQYSSIFDATVIKKIKSAGFQKGIKEFTVDTDKIYDSFEYLEKGKLTLPKLKDLRKSLEKDSFFIKNNKVTLSGVDPLVDIKGLDIKISEIEEEIKQSPAFQEIEKMLSDAKGMILKDIIETHPDIVEFLSLAKLGSLRKMLWKSYLKKYETLLNELINKYQALSEAIDAVKIDDTPWKQALDIFNQRFSVPFSMSVANLKGAVIGESIPQVEFTFKRGTQRKTINRSKLEELNTLSRGEQRALYTKEQLKLLEGKLAAPCQIHIENGITFDTDMNLIPCNMHFENRIGRLGTDFSSYEEFEVAAQKSMYRSTINRLKQYPSDSCKSCEHLDYCYGGCPVLWKNYSYNALMNLKRDTEELR